MAVTTFSKLTNNAKTTLNGAILAGDTACVVASGSSLPSSGSYYLSIFEDDPDVNEIVLVTARSGTSITTMVRGQQGTAASAWSDGANVQLLWTASHAEELQDAINDIETRIGSGTGDVTITTGDLDMVRDGAVLNPTFASYNAGANNLPVDFKVSRGSLGTPTIVNNLDMIQLKFHGHDGSAFRQMAELRAYVNGTPGSGDMPGALGFLVSPDGSATPALALTLAQDKSAAFAGAITGATTLNMTGAATFQSTAQVYSDLTLGNSGVGNRRVIIRASSGYRAETYLGGDGAALRWAFQKDQTAESGSDAGSDFRLSAYTDGGSFIDSPFICTRASGGAFTFYRPVTFTKDVTFGDASSDVLTLVGRILFREVTDAGPMTATGGTKKEVVYNLSNNKLYVCTVTHATAATWSALN